MAADIGELPVTVNQWRYRGNIPPEYWPNIISKARELGHELPYELFVNGAAQVAALRKSTAEPATA